MLSLIKGDRALKEKNFDLVIAELESNFNALISNLAILKEQAETDELTKLMRRNAFMKKMQAMVEDARESGEELQLMMLDIDHFKKVNDSFGHQTGDDVIERVSELIKNYLKTSDAAGRYGGEEIIVCMQASMAEAQQVAENIRKTIAESEMKTAKVTQQESVFSVTVSIGIASTAHCGYFADVLIREADQALYAAKNSGRNNIKTAA